MRERLNKLIGKSETNFLQMGTFHSLCAKFLRQHSHKVGLETNFTICDAEERLVNNFHSIATANICA